MFRDQNHFFFNQQLHFVTQINTKNSHHWSTNTKRKSLSMSRYSPTNLFGSTTACFDTQRSIQTLFTWFITQLSQLILEMAQPLRSTAQEKKGEKSAYSLVKSLQLSLLSLNPANMIPMAGRDIQMQVIK